MRIQEFATERLAGYHKWHFKKTLLTSFAIFKLLLPSARPRSLVCTPTSDPEAVVSNPTEVKIFHVLCLVPIIPGLTKANAQS